MNTKKQHQAIGLTLGLFLFAVYLLSYRGGFHSVDEVSTFAVTESLVKFGALNTDQIAWTQWVTTQAEAQGFFGQDGHVYSKKGFAISLAQAPLYWLALIIPSFGLLQTVSLLNAILTASTAVIIYRLLRRWDMSNAASIWVALIYGLGTLAWVYAKYLFSGTLAGFLIILTLYHLYAYRQDKQVWRLGVAGFSGGLTVLARANNLILLVFLGVYLLYVLVDHHKKEAKPQPLWQTGLVPIAVFGISTAFAGLILLWYNWVRAGNPFQTGYDLAIFSPNILIGLYKLLLSPLRGLFVYSPVLILAIPGWVILQRRFKAEAWLLLGLAGSTLLLFSAWSSGEGLSWGSRFLVPIVPLFVVALASLMADFPIRPVWQKGLIFLIGLTSFAIQIIGVVINPWVYLNALQSQFGGEFFLERTSALTDYSTTQIVGQIRHWSVENSDLIWWQIQGFDGVAFAVSVFLVLIAGGLLYRCMRLSAVPLRYVDSGWPLGLLALAVTYFLLTRYYHSDAQFGSPDNVYLQALNQAVEISQGQDQVVTVAQYSYHVPMNYFKARVPLLGFAQNETPLPKTADALLTQMLQADESRIWLVTVGRQPADPTNRVEAWLADKAYKVSDKWLGETRLIDFGLPQTSEGAMLDVQFDSYIFLREQQRPSLIQAGNILPVSFTWEVSEPPSTDYIIFIQLIDIHGALAAQHDGLPRGGYFPTSQWRSEDTIVDNHGLALPVELSEGDYRLIVGLYDPADGQRLLTSNGVDFADLGIVTVLP